MSKVLSELIGHISILPIYNVERMTRQLLIKAVGEIERLLKGDFTEEEFQNLCHKFTEDDKQRFCDGCDEYQKKLFGCSRNQELQKENDKLRYLLASGNDPCVYCKLPRAEMARCVSGFPGCGRIDDLAYGDAE